MCIQRDNADVLEPIRISSDSHESLVQVAEVVDFRRQKKLAADVHVLGGCRVSPCRIVWFCPALEGKFRIGMVPFLT